MSHVPLNCKYAVKMEHWKMQKLRYLKN